MESGERDLNLVNLCSPNAINGDSGVGANAISRADRVFVTTPLYEVVWSPRRGLLFKSADQSLTEKKKAPILWSREIFNIIISPSPTASGRKSDSDRIMTGEDSAKIYLQPYSQDEICHDVAPLGSTCNNVSMVQSCPTRSNEHNPGTLQGMKAMKDTSLMNITIGDSLPDDKDEGVPSPSKNQPIANNARPSNDLNSEVETDGRVADCLPHQPEFSSNLTEVEAENKSSSKESLQYQFERGLEANKKEFLCKDDALIYDASEFNKLNCPKDLVCNARSNNDGKKAEHEDIANEDYYDGQTTYFTCLQSLSEKCRQISHLENCMYPVHEEEETSLVGSSLNENVTRLDKCKAKEKVSITERTRSVSKGKDDSSGSFKNGSSAEPFVTRKRTWSILEDIFTGSKRLKKSSDENSCSGPHVKEDSSFINWVSNVTGGFFRPTHVETHSLATVPNPMPIKQRGPFPTSALNDSDSYASPKTVGFGSLKTFKWPRLTGKSDKAIHANRLGQPANSKELRLENMTDGRNINRVDHDSQGIIPQKSIPISRVGIDQSVSQWGGVDQSVSQFGEPPPVVGDISMINSHIQKKVKDHIEENCNLHKMAPSSSSLHKYSSSPSEETSKIGPCIMNKSANLTIMNKVSGIPGSVWITRFSPTVAAQMECTIHCSHGTPFEPEKDECNMSLHHSQNVRDHFRDYQSSKDCYHSPSENEKPTFENLPQYSISPMGLACSKMVLSDPKTKSNFNRILPSQKLKNLEPMASVFAKRLDAFRHIQTSEVADDMALESAICLFCGKNGHFITSCSEVTKSELEDLLKNTSLEPEEKPTCLCLRCFQHTHWTIACPYASLTSYQHFHGNASIINYESFPRTNERSNVPLVSNHGVKICEKSEDRQHKFLGSDRINQEEMSRNATDSTVQTSILDKKDAVKGKQIASSSGDAELGNKSFAHFHNIIIKKRPDEQERTFERIRKLQLSRADVIRWMESSISHFSLEGFFLRVRLGKCDESQEGTCYHVACIGGVPGEKIHGRGKGQLLVYIAGSKCLIDCRSISNQDFVEDELNAWWSMAQQRGAHLPSKLDLDKKLQERAMLDRFLL